MTANSSYLNGLSVKIMGYIVVTKIIIVVIGLFVLCNKMKGLGQLLASGKMIPAVRTAPLNPDVDDLKCRKTIPHVMYTKL